MGTWGGKEAPSPSLLQVAVKLSGWRWRGQQALRLYPRVELGTVVDTVLALLEKLEEEESVLVEAVCPPARLPFPGESHQGQPGARSLAQPPDCPLLGSGLTVLPQAVPHLAPGWLCGSVLWYVAHRVTSPC